MTTAAAGPAQPAAARQSEPTVDVVVPVFKPGEWLVASLDSVAAACGVRPRLWIVDDDPLTPLDDRLVSARWPGARVIHMASNSGFAAACNRGIQAGDCEYVLVLNQDARLEPDYLRRLINRLDSDSSLAVVGGKLLHQQEPSVPPDGLIDTCGIEMRRGRRPVDMAQGDVDDGRPGEWREVFGVCAAAALYRRAALQQVATERQVFAEAFFMHKEDVDLAWRLRSAGYRAGVDTSAIGYHARGVRRATDVTGFGARDWLERAKRLAAQERAKTPLLRRRLWRNQVLLLLLNERPEDFVRSFSDLLVYQALQTGIGFVLDPIGTIASRLGIVRDFPYAISMRRQRRQQGRQSLREWLP